MASTRRPIYKVETKLATDRKRRNSDLVIMWQSIWYATEFVLKELWITLYRMWEFFQLWFISNERLVVQSWLEKYIPYVPDDFSESWRDGRLLAMLLNKLRPGCFPDAKRLDPDYGLKNVYRVFDTLEVYFGIKPNVSVEAIVTCLDGSDTKLFEILLELKNLSEKQPTKEEESKPEPKESAEQSITVENCIAKGRGLATGFIGKTANFALHCEVMTEIDAVIEIRGPSSICGERITTRSPKKKPSVCSLDHFRHLTRSLSFSEDCDGLVTEEEDNLGKRIIPLTYEIVGNDINLSYKPIEKGKHRVTILFNGRHVSESPYYVTVIDYSETSDMNKLVHLKSALKASNECSKNDTEQNRRKISVRFQESAENHKNHKKEKPIPVKIVSRRIIRYIVKIYGKDIPVNAENTEALATELLKMDYDIEKCPSFHRRNSWGFTGDAERKKSVIRQFCVGVNELEAQLSHRRSHSLSLNPGSKKLLQKCDSLDSLSSNLNILNEDNFEDTAQEKEEDYAYMNEDVLVEGKIWNEIKSRDEEDKLNIAKEAFGFPFEVIKRANFQGTSEDNIRAQEKEDDYAYLNGNISCEGKILNEVMSIGEDDKRDEFKTEKEICEHSFELISRGNCNDTSEDNERAQEKKDDFVHINGKLPQEGNILNEVKSIGEDDLHDELNTEKGEFGLSFELIKRANFQGTSKDNERAQEKEGDYVHINGNLPYEGKKSNYIKHSDADAIAYESRSKKETFELSSELAESDIVKSFKENNSSCKKDIELISSLSVNNNEMNITGNSKENLKSRTLPCFPILSVKDGRTGNSIEDISLIGQNLEVIEKVQESKDDNVHMNRNLSYERKKSNHVTHSDADVIEYESCSKKQTFELSSELVQREIDKSFKENNSSCKKDIELISSLSVNNDEINITDSSNEDLKSRVLPCFPILSINDRRTGNNIEDISLICQNSDVKMYPKGKSNEKSDSKILTSWQITVNRKVIRQNLKMKKRGNAKYVLSRFLKKCKTKNKTEKPLVQTFYKKSSRNKNLKYHPSSNRNLRRKQKNNRCNLEKRVSIDNGKISRNRYSTESAKQKLGCDSFIAKSRKVSNEDQNTPPVYLTNVANNQENDDPVFEAKYTQRNVLKMVSKINCALKNVSHCSNAGIVDKKSISLVQEPTVKKFECSQNLTARQTPSSDITKNYNSRITNVSQFRTPNPKLMGQFYISHNIDTMPKDLTKPEDDAKDSTVKKTLSLRTHTLKKVEKFDFKQFNPPFETQNSISPVKLQIGLWESTLSSEKQSSHEQKVSSTDSEQVNIKEKLAFWENTNKTERKLSKQNTLGNNRKPSAIRNKKSYLSFEDISGSLQNDHHDLGFKGNKSDIPFSSTKDNIESYNSTNEETNVVLQKHTNDKVSTEFQLSPQNIRSRSFDGYITTKTLTKRSVISDNFSSRESSNKEFSSSSMDDNLEEYDSDTFDEDSGVDYLLPSTEDEYIDDEIPESASEYWGDLSIVENWKNQRSSDEDSFLQEEFLREFHQRNKFHTFPEECKVFGIAIYYGYVAVKNRFRVYTGDAGFGNLSVSMQGFRQNDVSLVSVAYFRNNIYEVTYQVMTTGYYLISIRWLDKEIPGSPFVCKVTF